MASIDLNNSFLPLAAMSSAILLFLTWLLAPNLVSLRAGKAGHPSPAPAPTPAPARKSSRDTSTTYRVRGIPLDFTIDSFQASLSDATDGDSTVGTVKSLSPNVQGDEQEATVCFAGPRPKHPPCIGNYVVDQDFLGLTTLFSPTPEDHKIDIVAISGLGGHAFGSFQARAEDERSTGFMWLRDRLYKDLRDERTDRPMARIMTYGYKSELLDSHNFEDLDSLGKRFATALSGLALSPTRRPIIIIAHSLGGLIVKKALILISQEAEETFARLHRSVYGLVFFGVPNDGMETKHLIAMVGDKRNRFLIESLSNVNPAITAEMSRNFLAALGSKDSAGGDTEVFCFYETLESPVPEKLHGTWRMSDDKHAVLVTQSSATRVSSHWDDGVGHSCSIARTHSDMVKFSPFDNEYENVRVRLQGIAGRARLREPRVDANLVAQTRRQFKGLLANLSFDGMVSKLERLKEIREDDTCQWLLESPEFCFWNEDLLADSLEPRVLILTGRPGCGKSVAMAQAVVKMDSQHMPPDQVVVSFFFDGRSPIQHPLQKSATGFYRAMLHQLIYKVMDLDNKTILETETLLRELISGHQSNFGPTALRAAIKAILRHLQTARLTILLDGLEECADGSDEHDTLFKFLFRDLLEECADTRVCLSARVDKPTDDLPESTSVVWVDRRNGDDIRKFLDLSLSGAYLKKKPGLRRHLIRQIDSKASGTFLWAKIVVTNIKRKAGPGKDKDVLGLINEVPRDLFPLYQSVLSQVDTHDRETYRAQAQALLQHVQIAARPLTVREAASLLEFASNKSRAPDFEFEPNPDLENVEHDIKTISCGLVECRSLSTGSEKDEMVLQFIHKSVGDFLLEVGVQDDLVLAPRHGDAIAMTTELAEAQFHLNASELGLRVIVRAIDKISEDGEGAEDDGSTRRSRCSKRSKRKLPPMPPMLPYAAQFWMLHARKGESAIVGRKKEDYADFLTHCTFESTKVARLYREFLEEGYSAYLKMDLADAPNPRFIHGENCLFVLAAFEGCTHLAARHLDGDCDRCGPSSQPLNVADDEIIWDEEVQITKQSPLQRAVFLAVSQGHTETAQVLLDLAAKKGIAASDVLNSRFRGAQTPLSLACCQGQVVMASLLIDQGADVFLAARGQRQGPPLHIAASQGMVDIVKLIVQKRRDRLLELLTLLDYKGTTAVGVAVEECRPDILRFMLNSATDAGIDILPLLTRRWKPNSVYEYAIHRRDGKDKDYKDGFAIIVKDLERRLLPKLVEGPARHPDRAIAGSSRLPLVAQSPLRPSDGVALVAQA